MFTLVGWNQAVVPVASLENIQGAEDQHVKVVDDRIFIPSLNRLIFAFARGRHCQRARLMSPSLRRLSYLMINPLDNLAVTDAQALIPVMYQGLSPLPFVMNEGLEAQVYLGAPDADLQTVAVALSDRVVAPVAGEIWTVRATATITAIAGRWVNSEITFDETLPVGRYQIVGADCWSLTGSAFRFVPVGSLYRPGGCVQRDFMMVSPPWQTMGGLGVWCEFDSVTPPSLDLLASTEVAQFPVLHMNLIKIA